MRKRGKYEAVKTSPRSRRGKHRGLLQIYVTSLTTLLMCFSMFLGTTMAWFTDTISSGGNLIQTGVLKVDVQYESRSLRENPGIKVFEGATWTPDTVQVRVLAIENEGTLDIMYQLGLQQEAGSTSVADEFQVYYKAVTSTTSISVKSTDLTVANDWKNAGSLDTIFGGTPIVSGNLVKGETVYYAIAIHMDAHASTDAQGKSIQMAVRLNAYQQDIPDTYIGTVEVSTPDELSSALSSGKKVAVTEDMEIASTLSMNGGSLDGSNHKLTVKQDSDTDCVIATIGGTINKLTINGNGKTGTRAIGSGSTGSVRLSQDLVLQDVSIDNVDYALNGTGNGSTDVTVVNSSLNGQIRYNNIAQLSFEGCKLGTGENPTGYQVIYGHTSYAGCKFTNFHLSADSSVSAETTVYFTNCTYIVNGEPVTVTASNFIELFLLDGDSENFAKLNVCEIYVDNVHVNLANFANNLNNPQTTSEETPVETTAPAAPVETTTAASEAASEPVTE